MNLKDLINYCLENNYPIGDAQKEGLGAYSVIFCIAKENKIDPNKLAPCCGLHSVFPEYGGGSPNLIKLDEKEEIPLITDRSGRWAERDDKECGIHKNV